VRAGRPAQERAANVVLARRQLEEIVASREGSLQTVHVAALLHAMAVSERTATLELERRQLRKTIVLEAGVPVDCRSNLVHETLGRFLVAAGRLREEDSAACLRESAARGVQFGQLLLERELVSAVELFRLLQQNLAKKLLDVFTWRDGTFRVSPERPQVVSPLKVRVPQLVVVGITRFAPPEEVNAAIVPLVGRPLTLHPEPPFPLDDIRLNPRQEQVVDALRGRLRVDELAVSTGMAYEELTRLLYALSLLGVVAPADEVPEGSAPPPRKAVPAPAVAAAAPAAPAVPAAASGEVMSPAPAAAPTLAAPAPAAPIAAAEAEKLSNDVMQAYLAHRGQDAYALLGLGEEAAPAAVQESYLSFAARFAPARFARPELEPVADKARELFLAGARAYAAIADPEQRANLLARRRAQREQKAALPPPDFRIKTDLLDPEVQFKRGVALAEAGQYLDAITQLEFASDCDPGNGLYRAELAWCRHRQFGSMVTREVLQSLEETMRVDPLCGLAAYYAGVLEGGLGRPAEAEAKLRKAMKLMKGDRRPIEALKKLHGIKRS
jgi:hypothetical protein